MLFQMSPELSLKAGCVPRLPDDMYLLSFKLINRVNTKRSLFSYLLSGWLKKTRTAWKRHKTKPCWLVKSLSFYIFRLIWTQTDPFPKPLCIASICWNDIQYRRRSKYRPGYGLQGEKRIDGNLRVTNLLHSRLEWVEKWACLHVLGNKWETVEHVQSESLVRGTHVRIYGRIILWEEKKPLSLNFSRKIHRYYAISPEESVNLKKTEGKHTISEANQTSVLEGTRSIKPSKHVSLMSQQISKLT